MIPVVWLEAHPLCWDQAIVEEMFAAECFEHITVKPEEFNHYDTGAVVVVPARYFEKRADWLNAKLHSMAWSVVLLTSDEESLFPWRCLVSDKSRVWVQSPRFEIHAGHDRFLPVGAPPGVAEAIASRDDVRTQNWSFAGQITHKRRQGAAESMRYMGDGKLIETPGFTQGLNRVEYLDLLADTKIAPCPSGPASPDTFRMYEALEAGCLPIADAICPAGGENFWAMVTPGAPWPIIENWAALPEVVEEQLKEWPRNATKAGAYWLQYKRNLRYRLYRDVEQLSGEPVPRSEVTVLVPTSPVPAHPSTEMIRQTIDSVRYHLPDADILVMCDGVREQQEHRRADYETYLHALVQDCFRLYDGVTPILFDSCTHQADMTREALNHVHTGQILFVEHDTPLVTDEPIPWGSLQSAIRTDRAKVIRLHHEALVLDVHEHLMLDHESQDIEGAPMRRTVQWSQRPHLASAAYYRWMLRRHFREGVRTMIEDVHHGVLQRDWHEFGLAGWDRHKLWLFAPEGNMKRSYTVDGRGDDPKFANG